MGQLTDGYHDRIAELETKYSASQEALREVLTEHRLTVEGLEGQLADLKRDFHSVCERRDDLQSADTKLRQAAWTLGKKLAETERSRDIALNSVRCWQKDYRLLEEKLEDRETELGLKLMEADGEVVLLKTQLERAEEQLRELEERNSWREE